MNVRLIGNSIRGTHNGISLAPINLGPLWVTPVAGSGLLDVGIRLPGVNDRTAVGEGPDLGAFERGGVTPPLEGGAPGLGGNGPLGGTTGGGTPSGTGGKVGPGGVLSSPPGEDDHGRIGESPRRDRGEDRGG